MTEKIVTLLFDFSTLRNSSAESKPRNTRKTRKRRTAGITPRRTDDGEQRTENGTESSVICPLSSVFCLFRVFRVFRGFILPQRTHLSAGTHRQRGHRAANEKHASRKGAKTQRTYCFEESPCLFDFFAFLGVLVLRSVATTQSSIGVLVVHSRLTRESRRWTRIIGFVSASIRVISGHFFFRVFRGFTPSNLRTLQSAFRALHFAAQTPLKRQVADYDLTSFSAKEQFG